MAEKPENEGARLARGKAKSTPAIDLPATEVVEVAPGAEAAPEAAASTEPEPVVEPVAAEVESAALPPAPAQVSQPSKLVPGLIGLIAGAIGGFGAYHLGEFSRSKTPPAESALVSRLGALEQRIAAANSGDTKPGDAPVAIPKALMDRLERAEVALANAAKGQEQLGTELGKLGTAIGAEATERKKALEALSQRPAAVGLIGGSSNPNATELDGLKSRLGSVETLQPKLDTVTKGLQDLSGKIAGLSTRDPLGAANARLAAVSLLEDGFLRGKPLAATLDLLKNLGSDAGMLAAFAPFAASGAPDAKKLLDDLRAIAPRPAATAAPADQSLIDRVKQGALSLVEVRRTGDITGTDDTAHLARAGQALQRGEIGAALALITRLSPAATPAYSGWRTRAEARLKAVEALSALRSEAVAALARAAATK